MFKKLKQQIQEVQQAIAPPGSSTPVKESKPLTAEASTPTAAVKSLQPDTNAAAVSRTPVRSHEDRGLTVDHGDSSPAAEGAAAGSGPPTESSLPPTAAPPPEAESDEPDGSGSSGIVVNLASFSKEEIFQKFRDAEKYTLQYKDKYRQVLSALKGAEKDRDSLKEALESTQEKSLRRIAELREQCELEKLAKRDLEANYHLTLDERNEQIEVLRTQIRFLKEGKEAVIEGAVPSNVTAAAVAAREDSEELAALRDKVKRLEGLLSKCKETIKSSKDRAADLARSKEVLEQQLAEANAAAASAASAQEAHSAAVAESEALRRGLSRRDEELATLKETYAAQLEECRADALRHEQDRDAWRTKCQEQLEKSRDVVKRLQDEKKAASHDADQLREACAEMELRLAATVREQDAARVQASEERDRTVQEYSAEVKELTDRLGKLQATVDSEAAARLAAAERADELQAALKESEQAALAAAATEAEVARQKLVDEREALARAFASEREQMQLLVVQAEGKCAALRHELDAAQQALSAEREALRLDAEGMRKAHVDEVAAVHQHYSRVTEALGAEKAELQQTLEALSLEHSDSTGRLQRELAALRDELSDAVARLQQEHSDTTVRLQQEHSEVTERLRQALTVAEQELAASQRDHSTAVADLQLELTRLQSARSTEAAAVQLELAAASKEAHRMDLAALEQQLVELKEAARSESAELRQQLASMQQELDAEREVARKMDDAVKVAEAEKEAARLINCEKLDEWEHERDALLKRSLDLEQAMRNEEDNHASHIEQVQKWNSEKEALQEQIGTLERTLAAERASFDQRQSATQEAQDQQLAGLQKQLIQLAEAEEERRQQELAASQREADAAELRHTSVMSTLNQEKAIALQELEVLQQKLLVDGQSYQSEKEALVQQVEELRLKLGAAAEALERRETELLSVLAGEREDAQKRLSQLQQALEGEGSAAQLQFAEMQSAARAERETLERELAELRQSSAAERETLERELAELQQSSAAERDSLLAQLSAARLSLDDARERQTALHEASGRERRAAEEQVVQLRHELEAQRETLERHLAELQQALVQEKELFQGKLSAMQQEALQVFTDKEALAVSSTKLQEENAALRQVAETQTLAAAADKEAMQQQFGAVREGFRIKELEFDERVAALSKALEDQGRRSEEHEAAVLALQSDKEALEGQCASMKEAWSDEKSALLGQIASAHAEADRCVQGLRTQLSAQQQEAEGKVCRLAQEIERLQQSLLNVQCSGSEAAETLRTLGQEKQTLQVELEMARNELDAMRQSLEQEKQSSRTLAESLRRATDEAASAVVQRSLELQQSHEELTAAMAQKALSLEEADKLREQLEVTQNSNAELRRFLADAEQKIADAERRAADELLQCRSQLSQLEADRVHELHAKEQELVSCQEGCQARIALLEQARTELAAALAHKEEEMAAIAGDLTRQADTAADLREQCSILAAEKDRLDKELQTTIAEVDKSLAACRAEADKSRSDLEQQLRDAQTAADTIMSQRQMEEATRFAQELEAQLLALAESHAEAMRRESDLAEERARQLQDEVLARSRELEEVREESRRRLQEADVDAERKLSKAKETLTKAKAVFSEKLKAKDIELSNKLALVTRELGEKEDALVRAHEELAKVRADLQSMAVTQAKRQLEEAAELERMLADAQRELAEIRRASVSVEAALSERVASLEEALNMERSRAIAAEHELASVAAQRDSAALRHEEALAAAKDKGDRSYGELRQKFAAKLRGMQQEHAERVSTLSAELAAEREGRAASGDTLERERSRTRELELKMSAVEAQLAELQQRQRQAHCTNCAAMEAELGAAGLALKAQADNYALLSRAHAEDRNLYGERADQLARQAEELESLRLAEAAAAAALVSDLRDQLAAAQLQNAALAEELEGKNVIPAVSASVDGPQQWPVPGQAVTREDLAVAHDSSVHLSSVADSDAGGTSGQLPAGDLEVACDPALVPAASKGFLSQNAEEAQAIAAALDSARHELATLKLAVDALRDEEGMLRKRVDKVRDEHEALQVASVAAASLGQNASNGGVSDHGSEAEEEVMAVQVATPLYTAEDAQRNDAAKPDAQYLRLQRQEAEEALQRSRTKRGRPASAFVNSIPESLERKQSTREEATNEEQLRGIVADYEAKLAEERAQRRRREAELLTQIELLQERDDHAKSGFGSPMREGRVGAGIAAASTPLATASFDHRQGLLSRGLAPLAEPMEIEYLRNVLFEYMMGRETQVLSKVISTIMRFSSEQLDQILEKEEGKLNGSWLSFSK